LASGIVGRLIARFAGRGAAVISGAVCTSAVWPAPVLACSPLSCALAGQARAPTTTNTAALAAAHKNFLTCLKSVI
jgi:hypothetical protein